MNIKKFLAGSVAIISISTSAFAAESNGTQPSSLTIETIISIKNAAISPALGASDVASNLASDISASGLFNLQQNTGANSFMESANTLTLILDCGCTHSGSLTTEAKSTQTALILGDITVRTPYGVNAGSAGHPLTEAFGPNNAFQGASNGISGFHGGNGLFNVSQNTGPNSVLQASNNAVVIRGNAGAQGAPLLSP